MKVVRANLILHIGIDVETGIKGKNGHISIEKAHEFVDNVIDWSE